MLPSTQGPNTDKEIWDRVKLQFGDLAKLRSSPNVDNEVKQLEAETMNKKVAN